VNVKTEDIKLLIGSDQDALTCRTAKNDRKDCWCDYS